MLEGPPEGKEHKYAHGSVTAALPKDPLVAGAATGAEGAAEGEASAAGAAEGESSAAGAFEGEPAALLPTTKVQEYRPIDERFGNYV